MGFKPKVITLNGKPIRVDLEGKDSFIAQRYFQPMLFEPRDEAELQAELDAPQEEPTESLEQWHARVRAMNERRIDKVMNYRSHE